MSCTKTLQAAHGKLHAVFFIPVAIGKFPQTWTMKTSRFLIATFIITIPDYLRNVAFTQPLIFSLSEYTQT